MGFLRKLWEKLKRPSKEVIKSSGVQLATELVRVFLEGIGEMLIDRNTRKRLRQLNQEKSGLELAVKERAIDYMTERAINVTLIKLLQELGKSDEEIQKYIALHYVEVKEADLGILEVL
jgi:hypothetical protein